MSGAAPEVAQTRVGRTIELAPPAAGAIRREIERARGNEVCFIGRVEDNGLVVEVRAVARGNAHAVLAAARDAEPGTLLIHNHPSGELTPSDADLQVAARLYAEGVGLAIVDNAATELYVVVEPADDTPFEEIDPDAVDAVLAPDGAISRTHPAYEDRPTQRALARAIAARYNEGGVGLYEAGTGTGKSVAYLVPAIAWAVANRERTVVSTNTINLQEQLVGKDLPFLRRALGAPFRYALVKGRGNYVSIRRAHLAAAGQGSLFEDGQRAELDALLEWIGSSRDGSLQDLPFEPSRDLWDEVVSDGDVCLRARCPHFERCFYQRARRDAASADVLVVNHHLLFSDLAVRRAQGNYTAAAVLPAYRRVVLDEAHNLEDAATEHLGAAVSRRAVLRLLARLERRGRGVLPAFEARIRGMRDDADVCADVLARMPALRDVVERARVQAQDFFVQIETLVRNSPDGVLRLHDDFTGEAAWIEGPAVMLESLESLLRELGVGLARVRDRIQHDRETAESLQEALIELNGVETRVRATVEALATIFRPKEDTVPLVRWLERRTNGPREAAVSAHAAPVELAETMRDALFERVDTAVLTSATLATRDGFGFIRDRLGVRGALRVDEESYASPFDFERQTILAVPTDVPGAQGDSARFDRAVGTIVEDFARASDGGLFVLFTSYRSLRAVAAQLRQRGTAGRWPLFVQGEAPRSRLLADFTSSGRGVLLGVASFWEGVDVPGDPLRGLLITKLPFKVPGEPLTSARLEAIERKGGNSFRDFMLPHAALRLKQGFGRLIRSQTDRGAVVLLDRRVLDRGYGRYFLGSLPPAPVRTAPWNEIAEELRTLYSGHWQSPVLSGTLAP